MRPAPKVVISCAVTGAIHTPTMSPHLPVTPEEIAVAAIDAARAGAAILHLHARNPDDGSPTGDPEVFAQFLPRIAAETDAIINITTGGSPAMTMEDRLAAALRFRPEIASLNMGSMNFVFSGAAARHDTWQYEWEKPYVLGSEDRIFSNTFRQIEFILTELGRDGTRFEFECYDVGHLYTLAHFRDRGLVSGPLLIQAIFGVLGGIGPDLANLDHMIRIADSLFGDDYQLSTFAAGKHQMRFIEANALRGGHVRLGLEDSLYIGPGRLATSSAEQVRKAVRILEEMERPIAGPDDVRSMLALKGADRTLLA
jgi:3,5-dioxohexanoate:acetyl-CoA acetone transferase